MRKKRTERWRSQLVLQGERSSQFQFPAAELAAIDVSFCSGSIGLLLPCKREEEGGRERKPRERSRKDLTHTG